MALYDNIFARIGDEFADSTLSDSIKYLTDVSELLEINNFKYLVKHEGDVLKKAALKEELGISSRTSYIEGFYFQILEKHIIRFNEELNLIWKYKKTISEDFIDVDLFNLINKYNLSQIKQFINNNFKSEYSKIIIFDNLIDNTINIEGIKHLFIIKVVKSLVKDCEEIIETNATTIPYYNFEKLTNYNFIFAETIDVNKIAKLPNVTIGSQIFLEIDFDNVTFKGNITNLGNDPVKRYGFFWSLTNPQPYEGDNVVEFGDTNSILAFQKYIDSLEFGSTIYVRSFAENSYNIVISDVATFKTKEPSAPVLNLGQTLNDTSLTVTSVDVNNPLAIKFNLFLSSIGDSKPNQILNDIQHIGFKYYSFENPDVVLDNFELSQQENQGKTIVASNTPYKSDAFYAPALGKYYVEAYAENSYLRTTTPKFLFKLSIIPKVRLLEPTLPNSLIPLDTDILINYYDTNNSNIRYSLTPDIILTNNNVNVYGSNMLTLLYGNIGSTPTLPIPMIYSYNNNSLNLTGVTSDYLLFGKSYRITAKNYTTVDSLGIDTIFNFQINPLLSNSINYDNTQLSSIVETNSSVERRITYSYNYNLLFHISAINSSGFNYATIKIVKFNTNNGTFSDVTIIGNPYNTTYLYNIYSHFIYDDNENKLYMSLDAPPTTYSGSYNSTKFNIFNVDFNSITNTVTFTPFSLNNELQIDNDPLLTNQISPAFTISSIIRSKTDNKLYFYFTNNRNGIFKFDTSILNSSGNTPIICNRKFTSTAGTVLNLVNILYNSKRNIFYCEDGSYYFDLNDDTFKGIYTSVVGQTTYLISNYNLIVSGGAGSGNLTYITSSFITGSYIVASPVVSSNNHNLFRLLYVNGYIIGISSGSLGSTVSSKKVNINL